MHYRPLVSNWLANSASERLTGAVVPAGSTVRRQQGCACRQLAYETQYEHVGAVQSACAHGAAGRIRRCGLLEMRPDVDNLEPTGRVGWWPLEVHS